jgi:hypothetical protein
VGSPPVAWQPLALLVTRWREPVEVRRTIVICCAAVVATLVPSLSARTRASGGNGEDATWANIWVALLRVARRNPLLARSRVVEHRYSEATQPLLITAEALAFFETQETGYGWPGADAGDTRQQILNYAKGIETNNSNALSNIDTWLDQIRQWNDLQNTVGITH